MAETVYATVSTPGPPGPTGPAGYSPKFIVAAGAPSAGVGNNGDMYINSTTGDVYGPKTAGAWGAIAANIKGPTGAAGYSPQYIVAAGAPSAGVGNNGDMYIDSSTSNVYGPKAGGNWGAIVCNIKGSTGAAGPQGPPGVAYTPRGAWAAGTTYAQGDEATDGSILYISLQSSNTGHTPASSPTWWQPVASGGSQTPWTSDHDANTFKLFNSSGIGVNITTAAGIPIHTPTAGRGYVTIKGASDLGCLELAAGSADADGTALGQICWTDPTNSTAEKRVAQINAYRSGTLANNRGSYMTFTTRADQGGGNIERVRITNTGNVGIGTASPLYPFVVVNAGTASGGTNMTIAEFVKDSTHSGIILGYDGTTGNVATIGSNSGGAASAIAFHTFTGSAWGERVRISPAGNVGIGTTNPGGTLDVQHPAADSGTILRLAVGINGFNFSRNDPNGALLIQGNQAGFNSIGLCPTSGNVGIGTTNPAARLHAVGSGQTAASVTFDAPCNLIVTDVPGDIQLAMGVHNASPWPVWLQSRGSSNNAWYLALNPLGGQVYIGRLSGNYALDVQGDVNCTGAFRVNGTPISGGGGYTTQTAYNSTQRPLGTNFQNTTGKPLLVMVSVFGGAGSNITAKADSSTSPNTVVGFASVPNGGNGANLCVTFAVMPSHYYRVDGATWSNWVEWN